MKSMTGFGKSNVQTSDYAIDVTVRAVNGRFLEIKFFGPKIYAPLEIEIRKRIGKSILRGTVEVFVNRKSFSGNEQVNFNEKLAAKWLKGFNQAASHLNLEEVSDPRILLNIPEFVKVEDENATTPKEKKDLFGTIDKAVAACLKVKAKEGAALRKDIEGHLKSLKAQVNHIKKLRKQTQNDLAERYRSKLEKNGYPGEVDPQRLAQEIVILVDKSDISEEIQRLEAHIKAVMTLVKVDGIIGKKMDFYAQELLREVNTIGSKSSRSELTHHVVESKGLVEKYREQVQNVE